MVRLCFTLLIVLSVYTSLNLLLTHCCLDKSAEQQDLLLALQYTYRLPALASYVPLNNKILLKL